MPDWGDPHYIARQEITASHTKSAASLEAARQMFMPYRHGRYAAVATDWDFKPGFLYCAVRAITARINQNYDGWPSSELKKSYRTFLGKPCFVNHQNFDPRKARGKVVAARYIENGRDKYIETVMEIDAQRFPKLAHEIKTGGMDSVSMGVEAGFTICSYCGNRAVDVPEFCAHVKYHKGEKLPRINARTGAKEDVLVYEKCYKLGFFELSFVFDPADETAVVSRVLHAGRTGAAAAQPPADEIVEGQMPMINPSTGMMPTAAYKWDRSPRPTWTPWTAEDAAVEAQNVKNDPWAQPGVLQMEKNDPEVQRQLHKMHMTPEKSVYPVDPGDEPVNLRNTLKDAWEEYAYEDRGLADQMAGRHAPWDRDDIDQAHRNPAGADVNAHQASYHLGYGEVEAPEDIDTLRSDDDEDGEHYTDDPIAQDEMEKLIAQAREDLGYTQGGPGDAEFEEVPSDEENDSTDDWKHYVDSPKELRGPDLDHTKRLDRDQEQEGLDADRRVEDVEDVGGPSMPRSGYRYADRDRYENPDAYWGRRDEENDRRWAEEEDPEFEAAMAGRKRGGSAPAGWEYGQLLEDNPLRHHRRATMLVDPRTGMRYYAADEPPPDDDDGGGDDHESESDLLAEAEHDLEKAGDQDGGDEDEDDSSDEDDGGDEDEDSDDGDGGGGPPPWLEGGSSSKESRRYYAGNYRSSGQNYRRARRGRRMSLAKRGQLVASRQRWHRYADNDSGHVDGGPYNMDGNDQGDQEDVYISQTPGAEAVDAPTPGDGQISNTENNLVASLSRRIRSRNAAQMRDMIAYEQITGTRIGGYRYADGTPAPPGGGGTRTLSDGSQVQQLPPGTPLPGMNQNQMNALQGIMKNPGSIQDSMMSPGQTNALHELMQPGRAQQLANDPNIPHLDASDPRAQAFNQSMPDVSGMVNALKGSGMTGQFGQGGGGGQGQPKQGRYYRYADAVEDPQEVDPTVNAGRGAEEVTGDDFTDVGLDYGREAESVPKDASLRPFRAFDRWLVETTGRTARQHGNAHFLRRQAARFCQASGVNVEALFPALGIVLREARRNERSAMYRYADDKLEVAAPQGRIDVEQPVRGTTDADAQASQFDLQDFGGNASDNLADPELSPDSQIWAPGEGKGTNKSSARRADGIAAVRYAEAFIEAGLAPNTPEEKWKIAGLAQTMRHGTIVDRTRLLDAINSVRRTSRRTVVAQRGAPRGLPPGFGQRQLTAGVNAAAQDISTDAAIFFK